MFVIQKKVNSLTHFFLVYKTCTGLSLPRIWTVTAPELRHAWATEHLVHKRPHRKSTGKNLQNTASRPTNNSIGEVENGNQYSHLSLSCTLFLFKYSIWNDRYSYIYTTLNSLSCIFFFCMFYFTIFLGKEQEVSWLCFPVFKRVSVQTLPIINVLLLITMSCLRRFIANSSGDWWEQNRNQQKYT